MAYYKHIMLTDPLNIRRFIYIYKHLSAVTLFIAPLVNYQYVDAYSIVHTSVIMMYIYNTYAVYGMHL